MVDIVNKWSSLDPPPTDRQIYEFMKDSKSYDPWKSLDIRFYTNRFPAKVIFKHGHKPDILGEAENDLLYKMCSVAKFSSVCGFVEIQDHLIAIGRKRKILQVALQICDECNWINPGGHHPVCSLGIVEHVHET